MNLMSINRNYENLHSASGNSNDISSGNANVNSSITDNKRVDNCKWKCCLIYIIIVIIILIIFLINFIMTFNAFEDNRTFSMSPKLICAEYNLKHNECMNRNRNIEDTKEIIEDCKDSNNRLKTCYDKVRLFNSKCYSYLSEFEMCVRTGMKINTDLKYLRLRCKAHSDNINMCTSDYMRLDPFILFKQPGN